MTISHHLQRERGAEVACNALEKLVKPNIWNAQTFDGERRRLVPCFEQFYGTAVELVAVRLMRDGCPCEELMVVVQQTI